MVTISTKAFSAKSASLLQMPVSGRLALLLWGGTSLGLAAAFLPVLTDMVRAWLSSPTYLHGVIIVPICLYLIWEKRAMLAAMAPQPTWVALVPAATGGALLAIGAHGGFNILEHAGLVGLFISAAIMFLGLPLSRVLWFPLFYLIFMIPFGAEFTPFLQKITADMIVFYARLGGIAILRDGLLLETPAGTFFVADACAGLRFLIATIVVSVLFCYFFFTSRLKIGVFLTLAIIIPIIANGLRATAIVVIATLSDMEIAVGFDHIVYGWGFFAVILGLQFLIGFKLADPPRAPELPTTRDQQVPLSRFGPGFMVFALLIAASCVIWINLS